MSYLEEKGIVHRDLAASNVLISKDNVAKVSDFGLSKKIMDDTRNGVRIRIKWSSPEAIKDRVNKRFVQFNLYLNFRNIVAYLKALFKQIGHVELWNFIMGNIFIWKSALSQNCKLYIRF